MATYCERCGGTLTFDHSIDKLSCKLCLRTFEINEIKMIDDDIPDVLPEVNIPLFKPVKGRS